MTNRRRPNDIAAGIAAKRVEAVPFLDGKIVFPSRKARSATKNAPSPGHALRISARVTESSGGNKAMPNGFTKEKAGNLATIAQSVVDLMIDPAIYGLGESDLESLAAMRVELNDAIVEQEVAKNAMATATLRKNSAQAAVAGMLSAMVATAEARTSVSDAMLVSVGFAPRPQRGGRGTLPLPPKNLVAVPFADGTVKLTWNRAGNAPKATFVIESSVDGGSWTMVRATTRTRETLAGFVPGEPAWFRVSVAHARGGSSPSSPVAIYAAGAASAQRRAA